MTVHTPDCNKVAGGCLSWLHEGSIDLVAGSGSGVSADAELMQV